MTTAAAPWRRSVRACSRNTCSPSFRLIELTTGLPCTHLSPASITDHFEESIITGTRAMSGSAATRLDRKSTRLNSSHLVISYAVFCLKKKKLPNVHYILSAFHFPD